MRTSKIWRQLLGVERTVIERVELDEDEGVLVFHVRPWAAATGRCGVCGRRAPGRDQGGGRRRWRALDLGVTKALLEQDVGLQTSGFVGTGTVGGVAPTGPGASSVAVPVIGSMPFSA